MEIEKCSKSPDKKIVNPPLPITSCTFVVVETWDEQRYPKSCDTAYVLKDNSGMWLWSEEAWLFVSFSGVSQVPADWQQQNEEAKDFIKNKPFKTLGDGLNVSTDGGLEIRKSAAYPLIFEKEVTGEEGKSFAQVVGNLLFVRISKVKSTRVSQSFILGHLPNEVVPEIFAEGCGVIRFETPPAPNNVSGSVKLSVNGVLNVSFTEALETACEISSDFFVPLGQ